MMAPSKQVVEAPRLLLPRLTWNGVSPRTTLSPIQLLPVSTRRQKRRDNLNGIRNPCRQLHTSSFASSSHYFPAARSQSASLTSRSTRPTSNRSSNTSTEPVRYNGVYVAIFKPARRAFHASAVMRRDHHFDTLKFVQRLKDDGFSEEQAVAMMKVLNDVIQESIQNLTRTMVLREGQSANHF
jgi:hypothetical protein